MRQLFIHLLVDDLLKSHYNRFSAQTAALLFFIFIYFLLVDICRPSNLHLYESCHLHLLLDRADEIFVTVANKISLTTIKTFMSGGSLYMRQGSSLSHYSELDQVTKKKPESNVSWTTVTVLTD